MRTESVLTNVLVSERTFDNKMELTQGSINPIFFYLNWLGSVLRLQLGCPKLGREEALRL